MATPEAEISLMRILLVEDDPTTSRSIELMLTHANLNVYCTTDLGEDGIDLAKLYDYDMIVLDLTASRHVGLRGSEGPAARQGCKPRS
jgi:two-component system cell cycle response regulator CtrA